MLLRGFAQYRAGVIHQNIDRRAFAIHPLNERINSLAIRQVARISEEVPAGCNDFGLDLAPFLEGGAGTDDIRSRFRQRDGHGPADAAARSSDERRLAVESKAVENHREFTV